MHWLRRAAASTERPPAGGLLRASGHPSVSPAGASARRLAAPSMLASLPWPAIGLLIWVLACLLPLDGDGVAWWAARFVLLAALVWIPLALRLVEGPPVAAVPSLLQAYQPWCALLLFASFLQAAGPVALLLAVPWAAWAALLGVRGLLRLREFSLTTTDELCLSLGMLALPVGGIWLLAARAGLPLLGFGAPFTLLTGMHFHYAGLLMPSVVGLTGRLLGPTEEPDADAGSYWPGLAQPDALSRDA